MTLEAHTIPKVVIGVVVIGEEVTARLAMTLTRHTIIELAKIRCALIVVSATSYIGKDDGEE